MVFLTWVSWKDIGSCMTLSTNFVCNVLEAAIEPETVVVVFTRAATTEMAPMPTNQVKKKTLLKSPPRNGMPIPALAQTCHVRSTAQGPGGQDATRAGAAPLLFTRVRGRLGAENNEKEEEEEPLADGSSHSARSFARSGSSARSSPS